MKKCMISQPMRGLTDEQIRATRDKALKEICDKGYEFVSSYLPDSYKTDERTINIPVHYLALSIMKMAECDAVYFCKGWELSLIHISEPTRPY